MVRKHYAVPFWIKMTHTHTHTHTHTPVSYTHLDVYKRQTFSSLANEHVDVGIIIIVVIVVR